MNAGTGEGHVGLHSHLQDNATPLASRWAPFDHPNTSRGHNARTNKSVEISQNCFNVLIFGLLIFNAVQKLKLELTILV